MKPVDILYISRDTTMARPWGVGDLAVAFGVLCPYSLIILGCTKVAHYEDDEVDRMTYTTEPL